MLRLRSERLLAEQAFETRPRPCESPDFGGMLAPILPEELSLRLIGLGDRQFASRLEWIGEWTGGLQGVRFNPSDTRSLSQADHALDVFILHGEDPPRLARIASEIRELLPSKPMVCVMTQAYPDDKALLLRGSVDEILTLSMTPGEAAMRVRRLSGRARVPEIASCIEEGLIDRTGVFAAARGKRLSRSQRKILQTLDERPNQLVTYPELLRAIGQPTCRNTIRALQVTIFHLRNRLPSPYGIAVHYGQGYSLFDCMTYSGDPMARAIPLSA